MQCLRSLGYAEDFVNEAALEVAGLDGLISAFQGNMDAVVNQLIVDPCNDQAGPVRLAWRRLLSGTESRSEIQEKVAYISNPANMSVLTADELTVINGSAHIESIPWLDKKDLPVFDCAATNGNGIRAISPAGHVLMLGALQPFISGACSKTVNMPVSATVQEVYDSLIMSHDLGVKCIAIFRPCAAACGMKAIHSDEHGRADIDYNKCVSCGMCLVSCPFSAIVDKSQIFQTIMAINSGTPVYAAVAPAIAGQFKGLPSNKIRNAFKALGFTDVVEVAVGADLCTVEEAKDFMEEVPEKQPFMATSCCPAWSVMAKKTFPDIAPYISMALTPMVLTGRLTKQHYPDCRVVFIGPCAAKKLEASRRSIRSDIDFVLTFEEVAGMFAAKEVDFNAVDTFNSLIDVSSISTEPNP